MLAGMVLHMAPTPTGVNPGSHHSAGNLPLNPMDDHTGFIPKDIKYPRLGQSAGVVGLAAAGRVKVTLFEYHLKLVIAQAYFLGDLGLKFQGQRLGPIGSLGFHDFSSSFS